MSHAFKKKNRKDLQEALGALHMDHDTQPPTQLFPSNLKLILFISLYKAGKLVWTGWWL